MERRRQKMRTTGGRSGGQEVVKVQSLTNPTQGAALIGNRRNRGC